MDLKNFSFQKDYTRQSLNRVDPLLEKIILNQRMMGVILN